MNSPLQLVYFGTSFIYKNDYTTSYRLDITSKNMITEGTQCKD
jgi:hypothetical protein